MTQNSDFFSDLRQDAKKLLQQGLAQNSDAQKLFLKAGPLQLDLSRQVLNQKIIQSCLSHASSTSLRNQLNALFSGGTVNPTEKRPALHWLLRSSSAKPGLEQEFQEIQDTLKSMGTFADNVIEGRYVAHDNIPIKNVINLGVGGSDLGPRLAYKALKPYQNHIQALFVANIDGNDLLDQMRDLDARETLFIVTSKTFSTLETLENTKVAQQWLQSKGVQNPGAHFAAATSRPDRAADFGIEESRIFPMWDWIGGRYSLLSSVGLALMLSIGPTNFNRIRQGADSIDQHVQQAPLESNAAFLQAISGLVTTNGLNILNHAVIAYDSRLELLPSYLQQLEMESNGKSVDLQGEQVDYATCPVLWGGAGTNTQHSFHQLLHQGTLKTNIDFLLPIGQDHGLANHQAYLQANCLAQAEALLHGKTYEQVVKELQDQGLGQEEIETIAPHKVIHGNKPCTIIGYNTLTPEVFGALIALYEHKVFIQSHFWNINPFDQWGVELGKQLCDPVYQALIDPSVQSEDPRTQRWADFIANNRVNASS